MKYLTTLSALLSLSCTLATAFPSTHTPRTSTTTSSDDCDCPTNGTLPADSSAYVSTSAYYEISAQQPDRHYGPSLTATVTPSDLCFITNLEIPASAAAKTCTLKFLFPTQAQAGQAYTFDGPGHFTFTGYATGVGADDETTYNNQPEAGPSPPSPPELLPGNAYTIFSGPCGLPEGATEPTTVSGSLCSADTKLEFTQSTGPGCPLGFFVELS